jgi:branched-subunit amino acid ABC-type transport system permease component
VKNLSKSSIVLSFLLIGLFASVFGANVSAQTNPQGPVIVKVFGFQVTFVAALFIIAFAILIALLIYALIAKDKKSKGKRKGK